MFLSGTPCSVASSKVVLQVQKWRCKFKNSVASSKVVLQVQRWCCKFKNSVASLEMDFRKFATEEEAVAEVGLLYIM